MEKNKNLRIYNVILILSLFLYGFFAYKNELIPFRFQMIALAVIVILIALGLLLKNRITKVLITILVVLLSLAHLKVQDMLGQIFLTDAQSSLIRVKKTNVSLIALSETNITGSFLERATYGTSKELESSDYEYIFNTLTEEFDVVPKMINFETNIDTTNDLLQGNIEVMILDETQREKLLEDFPGFNERTKIIKTIEREEIIESNAKHVNPIKESFIILMTGNDTWGDINEESRSDVNILAIVNPKIDQILMLSIPRDTYVPLACGNNEYDKLTHAGMFSVNCQIETIENFLSLSINYYAKVNFSSLGSIIQTLGNKIRVYNPFAFQGHTEEYYFEEGCLELDALGTLNYVRTRIELPNGDFDRQENQKRVLKSLIKKLTNPSRIFDLAELFNVMSNEVDTNIDVNFVNKLISNQLDKMPDWEMNSISIEGYDSEGETYSFPGQPLYVFQPYPNSISEISETIYQFMKAKSIDQVDFLNQPVEEVDVSEITEPTETVEQPIEPTAPVKKEVYVLPVDHTIEKYGHIFKPVPLGLTNRETKEEYIQACELSIGR